VVPRGLLRSNYYRFAALVEIDRLKVDPKTSILIVDFIGAGIIAVKKSCHGNLVKSGWKEPACEGDQRNNLEASQNWRRPLLRPRGNLDRYLGRICV